jgi:GntR family transcriptional regulator
MLPFALVLRPGQPIYEQIVYAAKKALAQGVLAPGDRFPSVRAISEELGVNPNTVQKAVAELTSQGVLEVHPGQGCFVAAADVPARGDGLRAIWPLLENLVIEASRHNLREADLRKALAEQWQRLKKKEG